MFDKYEYRGTSFKSMRELAAHLGIAPSTVYKLHKKGCINDVEPGGVNKGDHLKQVVSAGGHTWDSQKACAEFFGVGSPRISTLLKEGTFEKWARKKLEQINERHGT